MTILIKGRRFGPERVNHGDSSARTSTIVNFNSFLVISSFRSETIITVFFCHSCYSLTTRNYLLLSCLGWRCILTCKYLWLFFYLSILQLRLWFFVGSLNTFLVFRTDNDQDKSKFTGSFSDKHHCNILLKYKLIIEIGSKFK